MKDNNKDKNLIAYYFSGKLWPGTKYPEGHFNHFPSYNWGQSWSSPSVTVTSFETASLN